jgi:hypothetical protein
MFITTRLDTSEKKQNNCDRHNYKNNKNLKKNNSLSLIVALVFEHLQPLGNEEDLVYR